MSIHDALGDRMKAQYETRTRYMLPRRTYTVIRVDGKAFHTYTRGCQRPFDADLMADMDRTAIAMCEQIQGARLAFVQSDEISLVLTDFETPTTDAWFDGNVQKMASISASIATAAFNGLRQARAILQTVEYNQRAGNSPNWGVEGVPTRGQALFDSRVFTIPDLGEVLNYLVWRQQDATRNSIQMAAQACFSPKQLHGKNVKELQEMLWTEKQINWNDYPIGAKRGRLILQTTSEKDVEYRDKRTNELRTVEGVKRREWSVTEPPVFTQDRAFLEGLLLAKDGDE